MTVPVAQFRTVAGREVLDSPGAAWSSPNGDLTRIEVRRYIDNHRYEGGTIDTREGRDRPVTTTMGALACCVSLDDPVMSDEEAQATADVFRALSDPARVRIVNLLSRAHEPVCACNLNEPVGLAQPTVSHHLKKLVEVGLIKREQRGKWAYFSLERAATEKLAAVANLKEVCC